MPYYIALHANRRHRVRHHTAGQYVLLTNKNKSALYEYKIILDAVTCNAIYHNYELFLWALRMTFNDPSIAVKKKVT